MNTNQLTILTKLEISKKRDNSFILWDFAGALSVSQFPMKAQHNFFYFLLSIGSIKANKR